MGVECCFEALILQFVECELTVFGVDITNLVSKMRR